MDNPQIPGVYTGSYTPDQLIAGPMQRATRSGTITGGVNLLRGTVLGQQNLGTATATKAGTGNGTVSAVALLANAQPGNYVFTATSATSFYGVGPDGREVAPLTVGQAYADQLSLTVTAGGTAFVLGDTITVAVAAGTGKWTICKATATDGSQVPAGILVDEAFASNGDVVAGIYLTGEFNINAVILDSSLNAATVQQQLRAFNIHLKSAVSAADATAAVS